MNWRELPWIIAQTDINLAPLEMDNPFCQAKSEIKFVEAALVGVRLDEVEQAVARFYADHEVDSPGVEPLDFARVLTS